IPDNYYDDLDARLAPPPAQLATMRELGVLLDRDGHGEFLHFYTEVLGGRVFFEVVQRVGGYEGYGEVNAPIRMAAHRRLRLRGGGGDRRLTPTAARTHETGPVPRSRPGYGPAFLGV